KRASFSFFLFPLLFIHLLLSRVSQIGAYYFYSHTKQMHHMPCARAQLPAHTPLPNLIHSSALGTVNFLPNLGLAAMPFPFPILSLPALSKETKRYMNKGGV